jgi:hypothetical protein
MDRKARCDGEKPTCNTCLLNAVSEQPSTAEPMTEALQDAMD